MLHTIYRTYISPLLQRATKLLSRSALLFTPFLSANIAQAEEFPWWYKKLLSYHMEPWLIEALQNPHTIVYIATAIFLLLLAVITICLIKLVITRRKLKQLEHEHKILLNNIDQRKVVQAHQQTTIAHLSALIAHQSSMIGQEKNQNENP